MEFSDVVKKRRSIRRFKNKDIPLEIIAEILKFAFFSPSGRNERPWEFLVVNDRAKIRRIMNFRPTAFGFLETAPVVIIVMARETGTWICDASIAAEHIQLSATDHGMGSCWGHVMDREHMGRNVEEEIRKLLSIPDSLRILCVIAVGYPDEAKKEHGEDEVMKDRVHLNEYGRKFEFLW